MMSTDDVTAHSEPGGLVAVPEWADPRAFWEVPVGLVQRPEGVPGRVVAGLFPWGRRERQRVIGMQVELASALGARHVLWFLCSLWGVDELAECACACVSELVANAVVHAVWPKGVTKQVHLIVSLSARSLFVEVCDSDPRWPRPKARVNWDAVDWSAPSDVGESGFGLEIVRAQVAERGGEFGCVSGVCGKSVFFALPVPERAAASAADRRDNRRSR